MWKPAFLRHNRRLKSLPEISLVQWTAHEAFKRTSGAKALTIASLYGTAEAVPFVGLCHT